MLTLFSARVCVYIQHVSSSVLLELILGYCGHIVENVGNSLAEYQYKHKYKYKYKNKCSYKYNCKYKHK